MFGKKFFVYVKIEINRVGSDGKLIFLLRVFSFQADFEKQLSS